MTELAEAQRALGEGDIARGERLVRRALARAPRDARAHELMAYVLAQRADEEGALAHLRRATEPKGSSAHAWHQLGVLLRGRAEDAPGSGQRQRREARGEA